MEEPDRAASVQILENEQSKTNGVPNRESGRSRPGEDPQAEGWLKSMQRFREHTVNHMCQKEAYGSASEQDRPSLARKTDKFLAVEEGLRKFIDRREERNHK